MCVLFFRLLEEKKIKGVLVSFDFLNEFLYFFLFFIFAAEGEALVTASLESFVLFFGRVSKYQQ